MHNCACVFAMSTETFVPRMYMYTVWNPKLSYTHVQHCTFLQTAESAMCILRNLSYQLEDEVDPQDGADDALDKEWERQLQQEIEDEKENVEEPKRRSDSSYNGCSIKYMYMYLRFHSSFLHVHVHVFNSIFSSTSLFIHPCIPSTFLFIQPCLPIHIPVHSILSSHPHSCSFNPVFPSTFLFIQSCLPVQIPVHSILFSHPHSYSLIPLSVLILDSMNSPVLLFISPIYSFHSSLTSISIHPFTCSSYHQYTYPFIHSPVLHITSISIHPFTCCFILLVYPFIHSFFLHL